MLTTRLTGIPGGAEAFTTAAAEHKPIFLSIGYSTCHWCHVMEVESFDNVKVARVLNRHFISIKLDREQYPDIDDFYMTGVQLMTGHGGWPMSNFLLADGKPFFAGTYFPAKRFIQLLQRITRAWRTEHTELQTSAGSIHRAIKRLLDAEKSRQKVAATVRTELLQTVYQQEDKSLGGLAGAPKFPQEPLLLLLLDQVTRQRDQAALGFVTRALRGMGLGGIHDQVGGGFHRYSVDAEWLVPHFEKMLYNQSQLGLVYCEAFRLTGEGFYRRIATRLFDYVLRDMQLAEGGFYSATDADSEGEEGRFFLWSPAQLEQVLGEQDAQLITAVFQVTAAGNFEGATILRLHRSLEDFCTDTGQHTAKATMARIDACLQQLYLAREQRIQPLRDDKLIVAWCAAMATALVHGSQLLGRNDWLQAAERAVAVMLANNVGPDDGLQRIYLNGQVSIAAQLEDYANLVAALIALFDASGKLDYLHRAHSLTEALLDRFYHPGRAVFHLGPIQDSGPQLVRSTSAADGAVLSAVATVLTNLWHLVRRQALLGEALVAPRYRQILENCLSALAADINASPLSHSSMLRLLALVESGDRSPVQYAGDGRVRVKITRQPIGAQVRLSVNVHCAESWQLTASGEENPSQVPIRLTLPATETDWQLRQVEYPQCHGYLPSPAGESAATASIPVYKGAFEITAILSPEAALDADPCYGIGIELQLQLCGEGRCLIPETLQFVV